MARLERPGSDPARLDAVRAYIDTLIDGYKGDPLPGTVVRDAALAELDRIASEPAPASPPLAAIVDAADTISLDELRAEEARLERALAFVRGARLLAHYQEHSDQWIGSGAAANALNITPTGVKAILDDLAAAGDLEHSGKKGPNSRYRATTSDPIADALTAPPTPVALERDGATTTPSTLQGRTLQALAHHGEMTLSRLAALLELDQDGRRTLPATILRLVDEGEVEQHKPADGRRAAVYSATDRTL
jgi:hypothetical protein